MQIASVADRTLQSGGLSSPGTAGLGRRRSEPGSFPVAAEAAIGMASSRWAAGGWRWTKLSCLLVGGVGGASQAESAENALAELAQVAATVASAVLAPGIMMLAALLAGVLAVRCHRRMFVRRADLERFSLAASERMTDSGAGEAELREINERLQLEIADRVANEASARDAQYSAEATKRELQTAHLELRLALSRTEELAETAQAASETKGRFLANVSHELRTPLNGVLGHLGFLEGSSLSSEQLESVLTIRRCSESLLALIEDLLDFSKLEEGKLCVVRRCFDLVPVVEEVMTMLLPKAEEKGLEFVFQSSWHAGVWVMGDPARTKQVLANFVGNALKFTQKGSVSVLLSRSSGETDTVCCSVRDTGIGIPEDKKSSLFHRFSQVDDSSTRPFGGTGLGLAISKNLMDLMHGLIGFSSEFQQGSNFWFSLPMARVQRGNDEPPSPLGLAGVRVLVVDDAEVSRILLDDLLDRWGVEHSLAGSGAEALAALESAFARGVPFQIALIDQGMPEIPGRELVRRIRLSPFFSRMGLILMDSRTRDPRGRLLEPSLERVHVLQKPLLQAQKLEEALRAAWSQWHLMTSEERSLCSEASDGSPPPLALDPQTVPKQLLLVVEDDAANRTLLGRMLSKLGFRVEEAADGYEAVVKCSVTAYDLIFMDCRMPLMDGYASARSIRDASSASQHTPIVALTGEVVDGAACLSAGMNDFLSKPVSLEELRRACEKWRVRSS